MKNTVLLQDALHNLRDDSGASNDYCYGLVVGIVTGIMAVTGKDYNEVIPIVRDVLPKQFRPIRLPTVWKWDFS